MKRIFSRGVLSLTASVTAGVGLLVISSATAKATPWPVVHLSGTMSANKTISTGTVYVIDSTYTVPSGKTLTIQSGSVIKYAVSPYNAGIKVSTGGTMNVTGTSTSHVTFTSLKDDSLGGDSGGDGATTGTKEDYGSAINTNGGTVSVAYADFKYASNTVLPDNSGGSLTISDSNFTNCDSGVAKNGGSISLQRNTFNVTPTPSGYVAINADNVSNLTNIVLSGVNKNTFSGSNLGNAVRVSGTVPSGSTWTVDSASNAILSPTGLMVNGTLNLNNPVTYAIGTINVSGTLNIGAGSIVKVYKYGSSDGIQVNTGGTVNVNGTSASPVYFTSDEDDTLGGDTTGDGSTTGAAGDYNSALAMHGGNATVSHATFKYGGTEIYDTANPAGTVTVSDSSFVNALEAIYHVGAITLQRNTFNVTPSYDNPGLYVIGAPNLSNIVLSGTNKNNFVGTTPGNTFYANGTVPSGSTWTIDSASNVLLNPAGITLDGTMNLGNTVTYLASGTLGPYSIAVNGTLNIPAGSIMKVVNYYGSSGFQVNSGGTLNVNGTSASPVNFTSSADDSLGGDTTNDGSTTGASGDYFAAILVNSGTVNASHADFQYSTISIADAPWPSSYGPLTVSDSSFTNTSQAISHGGSVSLQRNTFNVSPGTSGGYGLSLAAVPDLTGVILSGSNKNTFTGAGPNITISFSGTVPTSSTWSVGSSSNVILEPTNLEVDGTVNLGNAVTYNNGAPIAVNGTLNVAAGSVVKVNNYYGANGIQVNSGGSLNLNGTSTNPVYVTSSADDSVGGDTTGDGSTSGAVSDYYNAISVAAGTVDAQYAHINYANDAVIMTDVDAKANFENSQIDSDDTAFSIFAGKLTYRGGITNVTHGINACNWDSSVCAVDAAYVDWGSPDRPFASTPSSNLACGSVSVAPWVHGSTTYNQPSPNLFGILNCDGSELPDAKVADAISNFQAGIDAAAIDCGGDYSDTCDAINSAYSCLGAAMSVAQSQSPWPLPGSSTAAQVGAFGGLVRSSAATYMNAEEMPSVSGFGLGFFNDLLGSASTILTIANAYNSCA